MFSVLVTGASRGIGLELVRQLIKVTPPPRHVFASCRSPKSAQTLQSYKKLCPSNVTLHILQLDVTKKEEIVAAAKVIQSTCEEGLTVLINNAATLTRIPFEEVTEETMMDHYRANVVGPVLVTQIMLPLLKKASKKYNNSGMSCSRAAVINISSIGGSLENTGMMASLEKLVMPYKTSKAALNMAMRTMSLFLKEDSILVLALCPGWVKTDMGTKDGELEVDESVRSILATLATLNEKHHGTYINRLGEPIPW